MASLAIVGAGIGGCSAAYFACKHLPNTKITIYNAETRIGGRILTKKVFDTNLELGAAFFNGANRTVLGLVNELKLSTQKVEEYGDFLVWDGSETVFRSSKNGLVNDLKILSKYKTSILNVLHFLNKVKKQLDEFYLQEQENPTEIDSLFKTTGLNKYYQKMFDSILTESGISEEFINEIVTPITRTIYNQNADLGGFAGISSLIGVYGHPIYRFTEGNNAFPNHLLEAANVAVKQEHNVTGIEKVSECKYRVSSQNCTGTFDNVIIATPLSTAEIEFDGINLPTWEIQQQQPVFSKVMRGTVDPAYFGLNSDGKIPAIVLTTKNADPIKHYNIQKIPNEEAIVTLTSTKPITDEMFKDIFKNKGTQVLEHTWKAAYPMFTPISKLPPTQLGKGMFYVNAIEPAVASMETSALAALNCVRMLSRNLSRV